MRDRNVILVTGGASGIGLAVVELALASGWHAFVADVNRKDFTRVQTLFGDKVRCEVLDVSAEDDVIHTVALCEREFGALAGVVNSAGIGMHSSALDTTTAAFRDILSVNLIGSFLVAREAAKAMRNRCSGSIVNIASVSALRGNIGRTAYGASKGGVIAMTKVMAVEWAAYGIRVNVVAPGPVNTPLAQAVHTSEVREEWINSVPGGRYGSAAEIAAAAMFLLDEEKSSYITGQTLCVDGGFTIAGLMSRARNEVRQS